MVYDCPKLNLDFYFNQLFSLRQYSHAFLVCKGCTLYCGGCICPYAGLDSPYSGCDGQTFGLVTPFPGWVVVWELYTTPGVRCFLSVHSEIRKINDRSYMLVRGYHYPIEENYTICFVHLCSICTFKFQILPNYK